MAEENPFHEFVRRIREGDPQAAADLVKRYEINIRVAVRSRLADLALRRQFDSMDICQSVLASFFVRAAAGQFDLDDPSQLVGLLVRMAQNKLAMQARHHHRQRRDNRKMAGEDALEGACAQDPEPPRHAEGRELLQMVRGRLSEEERQLADLRAVGKTWPEIAAEVGGNAIARRKQLTRALDRIASDLGLDFANEEG